MNFQNQWTRQRIKTLLAKESQINERDVYSAAGIEHGVENDQLSSVEEGFMQGYLTA